MSPEIALQSAVVDCLGADMAVMAIVAGRIFDQVPADRAPGEPPYVEIGPINRTRFEGCAAGWLIRMRLYATSTDFGRVEAWNLADAIVAALDGGMSKAAVCRNFGVKRTTLIETLARVGWTGSRGASSR